MNLFENVIDEDVIASLSLDELKTLKAILDKVK